ARAPWTTPSAWSSGARTWRFVRNSNRGQGLPPATSVQREHKQIARILEAVELHRMQVSAAGLHREVLLRPDRIGDRRSLQRGPDVEAPEFLERVVVIRDDPAV